MRKACRAQRCRTVRCSLRLTLGRLAPTPGGGGTGRVILSRLTLRRFGIGFAAALGGAGLLLRRFLVIRASVIRDVKAGTFKDHPGTGPEQAFHGTLPPLRFSAKFLRANLVSDVFHRLKRLKGLLALLATVLVGRHRWIVN